MAKKGRLVVLSFSRLAVQLADGRKKLEDLGDAVLFFQCRRVHVVGEVGSREAEAEWGSNNPCSEYTAKLAQYGAPVASIIESCRALQKVVLQAEADGRCRWYREEGAGESQNRGDIDLNDRSFRIDQDRLRFRGLLDLVRKMDPGEKWDKLGTEEVTEEDEDVGQFYRWDNRYWKLVEALRQDQNWEVL